MKNIFINISFLIVKVNVTVIGFMSMLFSISIIARLFCMLYWKPQLIKLLE